MTAREWPFRPLTGRHVLIAVVAFFAAVSAVNAAMIWLALDTHPGQVTANPYREGLEYNRTLEARRAQRALGWHVELDVAPNGPAHRIDATFRDRDGRAIAGLAIVARLIRPVARGGDRATPLGETAPGVYRGTVTLPAPGKWRLVVEATRTGAPAAWRMERELWLK